MVGLTYARMMKIAAAQMKITGEFRKNRETIIGLMERAKEQSARLIQFPEGALSGYTRDQVNEWNEVDWVELDRELCKICACAKEWGLWVVLGANHNLPSPHWPHNSLYIISDQGEIHCRYDKRFCSPSEAEHWYTPGNAPVIFEVDSIMFGCILCVEIQMAELFIEYERLGADCILFSAYTDSGTAPFAQQAQGFGASFSMWVGLSVPLVDDSTLTSQLIGPNGSVISQCVLDHETLCFAEIDKEAPQWNTALTKAKPWRRDALKGDIYWRKAMVSIGPLGDDEPPYELLGLADPSQSLADDYLKESRCIVARRLGEVKGVLVTREAEGNSRMIMNISVSELNQKQGIGRRLINYAISLARKEGIERLTICTSNASLGQLSLYQKCGFSLFRLDKDYFRESHEPPIREYGIERSHRLCLELFLENC